MERQEYTAETYPSFGKKYNGEKAIISLTSWKARINTVSKTIYSLIKQCPGFHIVLVLSEEEFPKMMAEMPENLKVFADNELIEILWVYKNYKAFKKVLFTMDKYRTVPIISADDDCIYTKNYAQILYNKWKKEKNKNIVIRWSYRKEYVMSGPTSLYFGFADKAIFIIRALTERTIAHSDDDGTLGKFLERMHYKRTHVYSGDAKRPYKFHDVIKPLHAEFKNMGCFQNAFDWKN